MEPFKKLTTKIAVLPNANVDTDQIIPARFLKVVTREGLGENLFAGWRYDADGRPRSDFVLNHPEAQGAQVLVAGDNFGCGSSREHAPWALIDFGFRAVISTSIADIFRNNAQKNGLLPIVVDAAVHRELVGQPGSEVTVDLDQQTLTLPSGERIAFAIEPFSRHCLLSGLDELSFILRAEEAIAAYERAA